MDGLLLIDTFISTVLILFTLPLLVSLYLKLKG